ncbi:MAG: hypothetical protein QM651_08010 [Rhodoblastus sp.]
MALALINRALTNLQTGAALPGATVSVYKTGTNVLATVYDPVTEAPVANPLTADSTGLIQFKVAAGPIYDLVWALGLYVSPRYAVGAEIATLYGQFANAVANNAALIAARISEYPNGVWRLCYASGRGCPVFFTGLAGTAAANGSTSDGGSMQDNAYGDCWVAHHTPASNDPTQYGAIPDCVVDQYGLYVSGSNNTTALQAWLSAAASVGPKICGPAKYASGPLTLPDYTILDRYWSMDGPYSITGVPMQSWIVMIPGLTGAHAIAHPHVGSTSSSRGQHGGGEIAGMTLVGPGSMAYAMNGWGIENTTELTFQKNWTFGFPRGAGLRLYAHNDGGEYGSFVHRNLWGRQISAVSGSPATSFVDPAVFLRVTNEVHVWCDGPYDSTGKCNDNYITFNRFLDAQVGAVRIAGHGSVSTAGSSYNTVLQNNMHETQGGKKIEEGVFSVVTDSTHFTLRADAPSTNRIAGLYVNYTLHVLDANNLVVESRRITAFTAGGAVTVASAFTTLPTTSTKYRISYARTALDVSVEPQFDPLNALFNPLAWQHGAYFAQPDGQLQFEDYVEETNGALLVSNGASPDVRIRLRCVVAGGVAWRAIDGSDWAPRHANHTTTVGGANGLAPETILSGHTFIGDVQSAANKAGLTDWAINNTGADLPDGACVRTTGTGYTLAAAATTGGHAIVSSRGTQTVFANGKLTPYVTKGKADVLVDLTASGGGVTAGWSIIPIAGSTAVKGIPETSVTNPQAVIGRIRVTTSGSGVATVKCFINA